MRRILVHLVGSDKIREYSLRVVSTLRYVNFYCDNKVLKKYDDEILLIHEY